MEFCDYAECTRCGMCCTGIGEQYAVYVTHEDMERLSKVVPNFREYYIMYYPGEGEVLKWTPGGECIFLEDGGCRVYDERPIQCRRGPSRGDIRKLGYACRMRR